MVEWASTVGGIINVVGSVGVVVVGVVAKGAVVVVANDNIFPHMSKFHRDNNPIRLGMTMIRIRFGKTEIRGNGGVKVWVLVIMGVVIGVLKMGINGPFHHIKTRHRCPAPRVIL